MDKFNNWVDEVLTHRELPLTTDEYDSAKSGWKGAIDRLKVTPELMDIFTDAFQDAYDGFNLKYAHEYALNAVFVALKDEV